MNWNLVFHLTNNFRHPVSDIIYFSTQPILSGQLPLIFCYASSAASNSTKTEGPYFQTAERPRLVPNDFAEAIENRIAMYYNKGVKFSLASVRLSARSIVHR